MRGITVLLVAIEKMVSELLDFGGILGLACVHHQVSILLSSGDGGDASHRRTNDVISQYHVAHQTV